ncbi:MAG TPA: histidinol-phosphate transaminase [Candidatus Acidoferrales bacterium]|jgi:histidinol-phosphate aminotransferase|nr:histidinol-phosphate transaminase [Candidatus Acidoferrales bacterium]
MKGNGLNRRQFARSVGALVGGTLVLPELARTLSAAPQHAPRSADGAIEIDSNENPYGPSPRAREAITNSETIACRYPDVTENHMFEAIAKFHNVSTEQVSLGCGSTEILRMADTAFLAPGKTVIVTEPTYEAVLNFAQVLHANPVKVPQTRDHIQDLNAMAAAANDSTGLIYICNPNNPTGTIVSKAALGQFMDRVPKTAMVLVDEAYFHFVEDPSYGSVMDWVGKYSNLIVARTFSKIYGMAGMRLGYAISTKENIRAMRASKLWSSTNAAVMTAAIVSLSDPDHVTDQRQKINGTKKWLYSELAKDGRTYIPSHANFTMIDVGGDVTPMIHAFGERNILVGRKFPSMGNWMRVSMGTPDEMQKFMAAFREIVPKSAAKAA